MGWLSKILGIDSKRNAAQSQMDTAKLAADQAAKLAAGQAAETEVRRKLHEQSLKNIAENARKLTEANASNVDMQNISNVVAGGTAAAVSPLRKKKGSMLSSSLGITV